MRERFALAALMTSLLAGCVAPREAPPVPQPRPAPPPPSPPPAPPASQDWRDIPITSGGWTYSAESGGTIARFGQPGAASFTIRCDLGTRGATLARTGAATPGAAAAGGVATIDITTSAGRQVLRASAQESGVAASLQPRDPLLDRMAFSRGRFIVAVPGTERLAIPAWPEFARVVEDCRG